MAWISSHRLDLAVKRNWLKVFLAKIRTQWGCVFRLLWVQLYRFRHHLSGKKFEKALEILYFGKYVLNSLCLLEDGDVINTILISPSHWPCWGSRECFFGHPNITPTFSECFPLRWVEVFFVMLNIILASCTISGRRCCLYTWLF